MYPGTHLLVSWTGAVNFLQGRRERAVVALTGIAPDLDGLGLIIDEFTGTTGYFIEYHHKLGHSIVSAFLFALLASFFAKSQKITVWLVSFAVVHLHIFCDLIGAKGPDGYQWPLYYLYPFDADFALVWSGQWALDAWQNDVTLLSLLLLCVFYLIRKEVTFFEVFSGWLDRESVKIYRKYLKRSEP